MPRHLRAHANANRPLVAPGTGDSPLRNTYFNLVRLSPGQEYTGVLPGFESACVVLSGTVDVIVGAQTYAAVGRRPSVWEGLADSVYVPSGETFLLRALTAAEVAIGGGRCAVRHEPFRIRPEDVDSVEVGSPETHSRRVIRHILGSQDAGRAGNLLISELYCDEGCWSGYPPHKHDEARDGETAHEEVYHYRFLPETGFGAQFCYFDDGHCEVFKTGNADTVLIEGGYHPTVTSPGNREYIFTVLVGRDQRSLVQKFHRDQEHLMAVIPGIDAMRAKFRS